MTLSFLPEIPKIDPEKGPNLMAGAASPLWLVFGGAAMAGATWWWWSARWREAAKSTADDLTLLVGIGPKLAASLADLGVTRFEQIAGWGAEDLADFDAKLNLRGRAERDAWVAQAKRLASL